MKKNKKQLHEALAVLLTKLSSARDNPLEGTEKVPIFKD